MEKTLSVDPVSGTINGALRPQKNLLLAFASLQWTVFDARFPSLSSASIRKFSVSEPGLIADRYGHSAVIGIHLLVGGSFGVDLQAGAGRRSIGIRSQDENLVLEIGD